METNKDNPGHGTNEIITGLVTIFGHGLVTMFSAGQKSPEGFRSPF